MNISDLWTSLTNRVCRSRSRLGSRWSQIRFWLALTATPLHTHREQRTSRIWAHVHTNIIILHRFPKTHLDTRRKQTNGQNKGKKTNQTSFNNRGAELDAIRGSHDLDDHVTKETHWPCGCVRVCRAERWWSLCVLSGWCSELLDFQSGYSEEPPRSLRHRETNGHNLWGQFRVSTEFNPHFEVSVLPEDDSKRSSLLTSQSRLCENCVQLFRFPRMRAAGRGDGIIQLTSACIKHETRKQAALSGQTRLLPF